MLQLKLHLRRSGSLPKSSTTLWTGTTLSRTISKLINSYRALRCRIIKRCNLVSFNRSIDKYLISKSNTQLTSMWLRPNNNWECQPSKRPLKINRFWQTINNTSAPKNLNNLQTKDLITRLLYRRRSQMQVTKKGTINSISLLIVRVSAATKTTKCQRC